MRNPALLLPLSVLLACGGDDGAAATTTSGTTTDPSTTDPSTSSTTTGDGSSGGMTDSGGTASTTGPSSECGNGVHEDGEECDDGNAEDGDGCNTDCTLSTDTLVWEDLHDGTQGNTDVGYGITSDSAGNVIAVGYTFEPMSQADMWIRKYAPDGTETWTVSVAGMAAGGDDRAYDVAVNGSDEIYVVGTIQDTTGNSDLFLRKMNADGMALWTATYDGPDMGDDVGRAVAVSATGIAVAGYTNTVSGENDIFVRQYDDTGGTVWTDVVNGPASNNDQGHGIGIDSMGSVIAAGFINVTDASEDAWLRKYDDAGTELWTETYADNSGGPDQFFDAVVDADDNVLAGGSTRKGVAGDNTLIRKHGPDGVLAWTAFYNAPSSGNDRVNGMAVDQAGNVIGGGYKTVGTGDLDIWLRKYDAGGLVTWTQSRAGSAMQSDEIHGVATDPSGNVLVIGELREGANTGDIWVAKYAP